MEELLLEILDHLLEAQEDGKTAHDIFGEDLKAYCDELIKFGTSKFFPTSCRYWVCS